MSSFDSLTVHIERKEVLRYLGYPRSRSPSPPILAKIEALFSVGMKLIRPRGAFIFATRQEAQLLGMPSPSERVALGVCTAGHALEEKADRDAAQGEALDSLILDAFGSAAAEAAADALQARVCNTVQGDGLTASRRVSPGYGSWPVEQQRDLLSRLPVAELGIHLTEGSMMIPRKSVSFGVTLTAAKVAKGSRHRCAACERIDCVYRNNEDVEEAMGDA